MSTKILNTLKINYKTYDDYRHQCFEVWCAKYSFEFDISRRLMITNDLLFNWYCMEFKRAVEDAFLQDIASFLKSGIDDPEEYQKLFFDYHKEIWLHYPAALLNKIKVHSKFKAKITQNK